MSSLIGLDFFDTENKPIDGLVSVRRPGAAKSPHEEAIVRHAQEFEIVDHVFFRRFVDGEGRHIRSSQVLAYVVDNSREKHSPEVLAELHHKLWLQGLAPLIYVAWPTRVDVLSCARKPDFWDDRTGECRYKPAERVDLPSDDEEQSPLSVAADVSDALSKRRRLSAGRLLDGTFWEDAENQKLAKDDAAAHSMLIKAIVDADAEIGGATNRVRRRLLLLMVLIAYLEHRRVLGPRLFKKYHSGVDSFHELLRVGTVSEVKRLIRDLETKFNGDVFSLSHDGETLTASDLKSFAKLVEGKTLGKQKHFWELFNFRHIPVEVISRLYQRFVTTDSAVYTPPLLASLLLDQVMPYDWLDGKTSVTVLDPSCGSGIFLVGAFKRLVTHWRSRHRWQRPSVEVVKSLLARSIHGVEMEQTAVDLTAFSLALALCDSLDPPVIWSQLRFDKLGGRNLRCGDFFDPATLAATDENPWPEKFDIIVGNPPFESKLEGEARVSASKRPNDFPKIPDRNAAYFFLERGLQSLSEGGSLCLLQPHGLLYNSKTEEFRKHLMQLARLDTVLDFVSLRGLFDGADPKTVVWHAINEPIDDGPIHHLTFRRTYAAAERIAFEIDHYDWHRVSRPDAASDPFVWRVGLLGGGRLLDVSQRLRRLPTLAEFVETKGWEYGEGFVVGSHGVPASHLTGKPYLPTDAFDECGINFDAIHPLQDELFYRPSIPERFTPPFILIKEHASLPVAYWDKGPLGFGHSIVSIHAEPAESDSLKSFFEVIRVRNRLYRFNCLLNGSRAFVSKATAILKVDIDRLPMPDDPGDLDLAFWEEALKEDVLDYMADYVRLGQDSELLTKAANDSQVGEYAALFVRMLGSVYRNLKAAAAVRLNGLIAQPFYFGKQPEADWLRKGDAAALQRLIYDTSREALRVIRVVRHYENNVILIVKPDRLRYWIRSTAIRDADDTLTDLRRQGW